MHSQKLKIKLNNIKNDISESHAIRIHRAISWLLCAEEKNQNLDIQFISLWISFNSCYAIQLPKEELVSERENFKVFLNKLIKHDHEKRFYNLLWNQFSGPIRLLINNQYVFKPFWDFQRGEINEWRKLYEQSIIDSMRYLSTERVVELLEVVLDRLYTLRNQLVHGGATFQSEVNRSQVKDGTNMLSLLVPLVIEIILDNRDEDWGDIYYPVI